MKGIISVLMSFIFWWGIVISILNATAVPVPSSAWCGITPFFWVVMVLVAFGAIWWFLPQSYFGKKTAGGVAKIMVGIGLLFTGQGPLLSVGFIILGVMSVIVAQCRCHSILM